MAKNEPQSYGSGPEWLKGDTGQTVNPPAQEQESPAKPEERAHKPVQQGTDKKGGAKH